MLMEVHVQPVRNTWFLSLSGDFDMKDLLCGPFLIISQTIPTLVVLSQLEIVSVCRCKNSSIDIEQNAHLVCRHIDLANLKKSASAPSIFMTYSKYHTAQQVDLMQNFMTLKLTLEVKQIFQGLLHLINSITNFKIQTVCCLFQDFAVC